MLIHYLRRWSTSWSLLLLTNLLTWCPPLISCFDSHYKTFQMQTASPILITEKIATGGLILSPGYPEPFSDDIESAVVIGAENPEQWPKLEFEFIDLDLEFSTTCANEVFVFSHVFVVKPDGTREPAVLKKPEEEQLTTFGGHTTKGSLSWVARMMNASLYSSSDGSEKSSDDENNENENLVQCFPYLLVCGNRIPSKFIIDSKLSELKLKSDDFSDTINRRGFVLRFQFHQADSNDSKPCGGSNDYLCHNGRCIKPELKCNGFDDCGDASDEDQSASCSNLPTIQYPTNYECGLTYLQPKGTEQLTDDGMNGGGSLNSRIVGGDYALMGSWPSQVNLEWRHIIPVGHICGGTLIHPMFVITAAHCFLQMPSLQYLKLIFGQHDIMEDNNGNQMNGTNKGNFSTNKDGVQIRYAASIQLYPGDPEFQSFTDSLNIVHDRTNDIALIRLNAPVQLSRTVWPACLPHLNEPLEANRYCYVTGWGSTRGSASSSTRLRQATQKIIHKDECLLSDKYQRLVPIEDPVQICTFNIDGGICHGDSGGPIYCKELMKEIDDESSVAEGSQEQDKKINNENKNNEDQVEEQNKQKLNGLARKPREAFHIATSDNSDSDSDYDSGYESNTLNEYDHDEDYDDKNVRLVPIDWIDYKRNVTTTSGEKYRNPMMSADHSIRWTVHGVSSYITEGSFPGGLCGLTTVPSVFTRVSTKVEWILALMNLAKVHLSDEDQRQAPNFNSMFRYKSKLAPKGQVLFTVHRKEDKKEE